MDESGAKLPVDLITLPRAAANGSDSGEVGLPSRLLGKVMCLLTALSAL